MENFGAKIQVNIFEFLAWKFKSWLLNFHLGFISTRFLARKLKSRFFKGLWLIFNDFLVRKFKFIFHGFLTQKINDFLLVIFVYIFKQNTYSTLPGMVQKCSFWRIRFVAILTWKRFLMRSSMHFQIIFDTKSQRTQITFERFFRGMYPFDMLFQVIISREILLAKLAFDPFWTFVMQVDMIFVEF